MMIIESWVSRHGEEKTLPGLPYSSNQLFWLGAANIWCSKYKPQSEKNLVKTGVHSPHQFRVMVRNKVYFHTYSPTMLLPILGPILEFGRIFGGV